MKRAVLPLVAVTALALVVTFAAQWLNHSRNGLTNPPDDPAHPTGPSTVIRGIMKRNAERRARERREGALDIERVLRGEPPLDGGAGADSP
ncbi:MAG TPA: hypothetical protein VFF06_24585 [Polyangia bacterium]|nr:hypothetical protein [Polyangia bacterium]